MNRLTKILIATTIVVSSLALLGYGFLVLMSGMHPIPPKKILLEELTETKTVEIRANENQEHIHGLLLELRGNISDSLSFSIGFDDSTNYRTERLTSGEVDYKFSSDWYSTLCLLTFEPTQGRVSGDIQIEYKFYGE
ncbi:hypothetical protein [Reichenbachiella sp.]|uniref:hypothetical protein n=1 Tax=Reichenbachiella sp. TaxID=2184521 RepID=UPI003BB1D5D2